MVHLKINFVGKSTPLALHLEMPSETQIIDLKIKIKILYPDYEGKRQVLYFNNEILSDRFRTLKSYGIDQDEANLDLILLPLDPNTRFEVQITGVKCFVLEVDGDMKVATLKDMIAKKWGMWSSDGMSLVHKCEPKSIDEEMENDEILHRYNIDGNSVLAAEI
ncbi:hypothetical protein M5689_015794 [Euphorbia peplus]|nr:hypothetical protein M5689_015794 [Euphorbia peplus]